MQRKSRVKTSSQKFVWVQNVHQPQAHRVLGDIKVGRLTKKENLSLARCSQKHPRLARPRQLDSVLLLNQVEKSSQKSGSSQHFQGLQSVAQWWSLEGMGPWLIPRSGKQNQAQTRILKSSLSWTAARGEEGPFLIFPNIPGNTQVSPFPVNECFKLPDPLFSTHLENY